jgi:hypothetical protein
VNKRGAGPVTEVTAVGTAMDEDSLNFSVGMQAQVKTVTEGGDNEIIGL